MALLGSLDRKPGLPVRYGKSQQLHLAQRLLFFSGSAEDRPSSGACAAMGPMITSNSYPQCLHLNSMSQVFALATLWPHLGHASQLFLLELPESIRDPLPRRRQSVDRRSHTAETMVGSLYLRPFVELFWILRLLLAGEAFLAL